MDEYAHQHTKKEAKRRRDQMMDLRAYGFSLGEVGAMYGITKQRVHQIIGWKYEAPKERQRRFLCAQDLTRGQT